MGPTVGRPGSLRVTVLFGTPWDFPEFTFQVHIPTPV